MTATTSSNPVSTPQVVALFSRGLDSILAVKVVQQQGLRVRAVKFITPFFGWEIKGRETAYCEEIKAIYDIDLTVVDISREYLALLADPPNGYGKNFNPCVDCKIMMLTRARQLAEEWGAAGLVTGEVIGQRPFSQRRDTLHRIENLSGTKGLLLRPLCAKLLPPSRLEESGLIDREKLFAFSGRGRKPQMALAAELGISDYPTPAGGCLLTDPGFSLRIRTLYETGKVPGPTAVDLLKYGRFTSLGNGEFFIVGRHRNDNRELLRVADDSCYILHLAEMPGPVTVLVGRAEQLEEASAGLCRHSRAKNQEKVRINWRRGNQSGRLTFTGLRTTADPDSQPQTAP